MMKENLRFPKVNPRVKWGAMDHWAMLVYSPLVLLFWLAVICKSEGGKIPVLFLHFLQEMFIQPQDSIIR